MFVISFAIFLIIANLHMLVIIGETAWRFEHFEGEPFTTRYEISLVLDGEQSGVSWSTDTTKCKITSSSSPAKLVCDEIGVFFVTASETKPILIRSAGGAYRWYMICQNTQVGHLQIQSKPSGLKLCWYKTFDLKNFDKFVGRNVMISGPRIGLYNYFVRDTMLFVKLESSGYIVPNPILVSTDLQKPEIFSEQCENRISVLVYDKKIFVTFDSFQTTHQLQLPNSHYSDADKLVHVLPVYVVTQKDVQAVLLMSVGPKIIKVTLSERGTKSLPADVETINIPGFNSAGTKMVADMRVCNHLTIIKQQIPVLVWNEKSAALTTITFDKEYIKLQIPKSFVIKDAVFLDVRDKVALLLYKSNPKKLSMVSYYRMESSKELVSWTPDKGSDNYKILIVHVGMKYFYVWNDAIIFYYYGNDSNGRMGISSSAATNTTVDCCDHPVQQITMNLVGEIIVQLVTGDLLYSRIGSKSLWKLVPQAAPKSNSFFWFDEIGQSFWLSYQENSLKKTTYDLQTSQFETFYGVLKCPYRQFLFSGLPSENHYRLDFGEKLTVSASIVYKSMTVVDMFKLVVEGLPDIITAEPVITYYQQYGGLLINKTVVFSFQPSYLPVFTDGGNLNEGDVAFQLKPNIIGSDLLMCPLSGVLMGHIEVGCPDNKYIDISRVKPKFSNSSECKTFQDDSNGRYTYTIDGAHTRSGSSMKAAYDYEEVGCPIQVYLTDRSFLPVLMLYYNDEVKPVDVDFVIYEHYNRYFQYNSTMIDVGCSHKAQTWSEMIGNQKAPDMNNVWTHANYIKCFGGREDETWQMLNMDYEVLNGSGNVALLFRDPGIYIFTAIIVDPLFSYCNLSTTFAIEVLGERVRRNYLAMFISLAMFIAIFTVFVTTSYIYFRNHVYTIH